MKSKIASKFVLFCSLVALIPLFSTCEGSSTTTFYVDAKSGNDVSGNGSMARPWQTLQKAAESMGTDDTCIIRQGVYRETVIPKDGQTFVAAPGERVVVTGTDLVSNWFRHSDRVFRTSLPKKVYAVFVQGNYLSLARYPNVGNDYLDSRTWGATQVNNNGRGRANVQFLNGMNVFSDFWNGGYFFGLNGNNFYAPNIGKIASSSGNKLALTEISATISNPAWHEFEGSGRGFIINHLNALDAPGEWYWGNSNLYIYPPNNEMLTSKLVEAQVRLWGFDLSQRRNVTIKGIVFRGASVRMENAVNCTIDRSIFRYHSPFQTNYNGHGYVAFPGISVSGSDNTIKNSYIGHGWGSGISISGDRITIENNLVEDLAWSSQGAPIVISGNDNKIFRNTIRKSSGTGIHAGSIRRPQIMYNSISDTGRLLLDSGQTGIYICNFCDRPTAQRTLEGGVIAYNYIGLVNTPFVDNGKGMAIYLDDGTHGAYIHHNVTNTGGRINWAIFIHYNGHVVKDIFVHNNTLWGYDDKAVFFAGNWNGKGGGTKNSRISNNIAQLSGTTYYDKSGGAAISNNREGVVASEFVNPRAGDFRLRSHSPSINTAVPLSGINMPVFDGKPDVGAYEYGTVGLLAGSSIQGDPQDTFLER
ncbi:right-handed parallel beta-helix repeat-containing protein [Chroococcidiopsis sp. SAG 2025]|uniref:right-handed parallel beta-helix repeat-containing protein n=1 Tax=Chroococcidiopsis sp. SAG 2025 TaxID=171389 RepID=UPI002936F19C|nr:right-handed parallel beta-helix repeat-containing protein [Chroococcidiopsis sp. SAG 2025]